MCANKVKCVEVLTVPSSDNEEVRENGDCDGASSMPMDSGSCRELAALRRRIDDTDRRLASVLHERGCLAARAARLKARAGVPASVQRDRGREHEIVERAVAVVCTEIEEELALNAYDEKAVRSVYSVLFEASIRFSENKLR